MSRITKDIEAFVEARPARWPGWVPLALLPSFAVLCGGNLPRWVFMWTLAFSLALGAKWLTWSNDRREIECTRTREWGYVLAWPGMDARQFLGDTTVQLRPLPVEWIFAGAKTLLGAVVVWVVLRKIPFGHELLTGWAGLFGLALLLHFGLFHLLALCWQNAGVNAQPIMRAPLLATSISEFWNRRWNLAFNQLVHRYLFRPLLRWTNLESACLAGSLFSGLVHDLVISIPAGGGYGLPTTYFLVQGCAVLLERSRVGRRFGLRGGWRGWLFTVIITAGPVFCLFHPPFIRNVILPMLAAIGATERKL